jgi:long-chain acyl-CoA synthetase
MLGYYRDPERTRAALTDDGWFRTHDLACMDSKGRYYIKGRLGNMIVGPSGENIYPEEIEQVINNMRGVNESIVIERDGKLVALVKFDDDIIDWDALEKEEKFFENLENWKKKVMDYVNKRVGKQSNIGEVNAMKEDFEKTATQKIRRFKYKSFKPEDDKPSEESKTEE